MSNDGDGCLSVAALGIIAVAVGMMIGARLGESKIRGQAISAGVAEWTVDPQTGETEFKWKGESK